MSGIETAIIVAGISAAATVGGAVYSASAQSSAAQKNADAQATIAANNAAAAREISEMNALADLRIAQSNADALTSTAAAEMQIAETNARRIEVTATATETAGAAEEERQRLRSRFILADQRARYGASGVVLEGSPLEVLAFSAGQEELDALTIRFNTGTKVNDLQAEALSTRMTGAFGVQDAALRARNLLSDAITRGEVGQYSAGVSGQTGMAEAALKGAAGVTNAQSAAMGTLASGFASAASSSSGQTLTSAGVSAAKKLWG